MAIAKVTSKYASGAGGNFDTSGATVNATGATCIVVAIADYSGDPASTIADSHGNSYGAALFTKISGNVRLQVWVVAGASIGDAAHSWTVAGNPTNPALLALVLSGTAQASAVDQTNSATGTGVASLQPGPVTPGDPSEIVITMFGSPDTYSSVNAPFTPADGSISASGTALAGGLAFEIQAPGPTARNPTWTWPGATDMAAVILTMKADAGITAAQMAGIFAQQESGGVIGRVDA